mgnify:CR=1 FL=1
MRNIRTLVAVSAAGPDRLQMPSLGCGSLDDAELLASLPAGDSAHVLLEDCRGADDLQRFDIALSVAEARAGRDVGAIKIVAGTASAASLLHVATLAGRSARLVGLAWDRGGFSRDLGCTPDAPLAAHGEMTWLIAARATGLPLYRLAD